MVIDASWSCCSDISSFDSIIGGLDGGGFDILYNIEYIIEAYPLTPVMLQNGGIWFGVVINLRRI